MRFLFSLLITLSLLSVCFGLPFSAIPDYSAYTFEQYEQEFSKHYSSDASRLRHKTFFESNLNRIKTHNSMSDISFFMKVNKYADLQESDIIAKFTGNNAALSRHLKSKNSANTHHAYVSTGIATEDLPTSKDWRSSGAVSNVKDQGGCGSCWAFAATETIESALYQATGKMLILSPQDVLECTPNPNHCGGSGGCEGATAELAFSWAKGGIALDSTVPYLGRDATCATNITRAATVGSYVYLPENNNTALLEAVATVGPISVSVDASAWSFYGGGVFNGCNQNDPDINHAVQLVGYGTDAASGNDYWLIRNSWGASWGESGYIRLYRGAKETCGTDTHPSDGSGCTGGPATVKVCGTCGVWYDSSYPTDVKLV